MMQKQNMIVVNQTEIAKNIYELVLQGDLVQQMNEPGQFVHIKVAEGITPFCAAQLAFVMSIKKKRIYNAISCGRTRNKNISKKKTR